jgi:CRISPR-associated exonuclease Cas4
VVELIRTGDTDESGVQFSGKTGKWRLLPVEYKRGKPKPDERDAVQLCAQAICLEEMFKTRISSGYLYYGETRHRHEVDFNADLRVLTSRLALRMHELYRKGTTPPAIYKPHCRSCSLVDICLPRAMGNPLIGSAYLNSTFESNI